MKIEYRLPNRSRNVTTELKAPEQVSNPRPPRISCLLALAHRVEHLVHSGAVRDYAEIARLSHVSRARVSQILKLVTLAPSIQEYLLSLPPRRAGREGVTERELRVIVREPRWDRQRAAFARLMERR